MQVNNKFGSNLRNFQRIKGLFQDGVTIEEIEYMYKELEKCSQSKATLSWSQKQKY